MIETAIKGMSFELTKELSKMRGLRIRKRDPSSPIFQLLRSEFDQQVEKDRPDKKRNKYRQMPEIINILIGLQTDQFRYGGGGQNKG
ncbi:MAG: hypothetical protein MZV65_42075 [Chromatiales bacterium]|nr:hypothetical protein [Chromatiales bacterium]